MRSSLSRSALWHERSRLRGRALNRCVDVPAGSETVLSHAARSSDAPTPGNSRQSACPEHLTGL
jgi:hypothetical protein